MGMEFIMIKKSIFSIVFFMSIVSLNAQENLQNEKSADNKDIKNIISTSLVVPTNADFMSDYLSMNAEYTFENSVTTASAGVQTAKSNTKFYLSDTYWIYSNSITSYGIKGFYQFNYYNNLVTYNSFSLGGNILFQLPKNFTLNTQLLLNYTFGFIDTGDSKNMMINWWDTALKISLFYDIPCGIDLKAYVDMSNFDNYTAQRFFAPIITAGVKYSSPYNFSVGAEVNLHYTDIFSFSRYLEYAAFTIKGEYIF